MGDRFTWLWTAAGAPRVNSPGQGLSQMPPQDDAPRPGGTYLTLKSMNFSTVVMVEASSMMVNPIRISSFTKVRPLFY